MSFPLTLVHQDKPDFLLKINTVEIGIEVTEAIPENYAKFCALAEREFPDATIDIGHFRPGAHQLSTAQIRDTLKNGRITSSGWAGDQAEQDWAQFNYSKVSSKLTKLNNKGFMYYEKNWLLIYDNLPLPHIHLQKAVEYLNSQLSDIWKQSQSFDAVFIEHGPVIVCIERSSIEYLVLNDIWE